MERKKLTVEEEHQNLIEEDFIEDLNLDPRKPIRFFIHNIIRRCFSFLFGWYGKKPVRLKATAAGELVVATTGTGYNHNQTKSGTAADTYGTDITFTNTCSRVDVWVWDNPAIIKRSADGITYDDEIEISANSFYSFDCSTKMMNIKNKTAGSNARYQFVGWW